MVNHPLFNRALLLTPFWLLLLSASTIATFCPGDNWTPYSDRCLKVVESITTYAEAKQICSEDFLPADVEKPMILEIKTEEEQIFMTNFIFNISQIPLGVWLGASRKSNNTNEFQWSSDSVSLNFNHWATDSPSDNAGRGCVEMTSDLTRSAAGDWRDVTCEKGNWVVCQKTAALSVSEMSLGLVQLNRWRNLHIQVEDSGQAELQEQIRILHENFNTLNTKHASLQANQNTLQGKHDTLQINFDSLQSSHNTLRNDHNSLNSKHTSLQASHDSLSTNQTKLQDKHDTLQTNFNSLQSSHNTLRNDHNSLNSKHTSLQASHDSLSTNQTNLQGKHDTLQTNFNSLQSSHNTLRNDHNSLNSKHTSLQSSHNTLRNDHNSLNLKHTSLQASHDSLSTNQTNLQGKHDTLQTNFNSLQSSHNTLRNDHNSLSLKHTSLQSSHNTLRNDHNSLKSKHTSLQSSHNTLNNEMTQVMGYVVELQSKPLPIGFIYMQLFPSPVPASLWPKLVWQDISVEYAGQFFRVLGGSSASYGTVQNGIAPRFDRVYNGRGEGLSDNTNKWTNIIPGQETKFLWSGDDATTSYAKRLNLRFHVSNDEVRPRNQAIKIWKVVGIKDY